MTTSSRTELPLHEEVLLLALRDDRGTTDPGSMYAYALGGAILSELLLHERISLVQVRKSTLVEVKSATGTGDRVLDEALRRIREARRRAAPKTWVYRFSQTRGLKVRIAERLRQKGILRMEEGRILWLFTRRLYPTVDPVPEERIRARLRPIFVGEGEDSPDDRTAILASLAAAASLLGTVLDKGELKEHRKRVRAVARGALGGQATSAAIEAVQTAVVAATTSAMVASSVAASS